MYQLYNLYEILHEPYYEKADFKSDIGFEQFEPKCPKLGILSQKVLTF